MNPILIIKCKIKLLPSIAMIVFGLALLLGTGFMIFEGGKLWWLIGAFLGLFCIYHWTNIILKGGRTLVFYVNNNILYFTYAQTKIVVQELEQIKSMTFFTAMYNLAEIQNFWRYIRTANGAVNTDALRLKYQNEKIELADLNYHELRLEENDLNKIALFLIDHNPKIQLGEPTT